MARDCHYCMSAGSVNRWGYCEVCGEDLEESTQRSVWELSPDVPRGSVLTVIECGGAGDEQVEMREMDQATAS